MKFPTGPAKFRFVREYQTLRFSVQVNQGQSGTAALSFPFDFIITGLSASAFVNRALFVGTDVTRLPEPPINTQMRLHQNLLDATPIPLRAAWGTGKRPAWLSMPMPAKLGWQLAVDTIPVDPTGGAAPITGTLGVIYVVHGYIPSPEEFKAVSENAARRAKRVYQTYTLSADKELTSPAAATNPAMPADTTPGVTMQADFDLDFVVQKINGIVYDTTNLDALNYGGPTSIIPPAQVLIGNRTGNLNDQGIPWDDAVGTAEFPQVIKPAMLIRSGDFLRASYVDQSVAIKTRPFLGLIGYVPTEEEIHRLLVGRGQRLPAFYDPQSARPRRARPGVNPGTVVR